MHFQRPRIFFVMQTTSFLRSLATDLHTLKVVKTFVSFFVSTDE